MNISFATNESSAREHTAYLGPKFELTLCLYAEQDARQVLKSTLAGLGESLTIAGAAPEFKVHIHTDSVDEVLAEISEIGVVSKITTTTLPEFAPQS
jgi:dihydroxyacetone kinase-like predicted kinase